TSPIQLPALPDCVRGLQPRPRRGQSGARYRASPQLRSTAATTQLPLPAVGFHAYTVSVAPESFAVITIASVRFKKSCVAPNIPTWTIPQPEASALQRAGA